jgi:cytidylate kinase
VQQTTLGATVMQKFDLQFKKGQNMKVITIDREYGAGGHTIGMEVAQRLGIEFYDQDIIRETAKASGLDVEEIRAEEERLSKTETFLHAITPVSFDIKDAIFEYEAQAVKELAKKGPCVLLGRCAAAVLEEAGIECVKVFLYADEKHRSVRASELLGIEDQVLLHKAIHKIDVARQAYYNAYTGKQWRAIEDQTLSLDTGIIPKDVCVDIICQAAQAI